MSSVAEGAPERAVWRCEPMAALDAASLYALLQLRSAVFVVEQRCIYQDLDGRDAAAWHVRGLSASGVLGFAARLLPPGTHDLPASGPAIGRVVVAPSARGLGWGRQGMQEAVAACERLWPGQPQVLSAQAHLQAFYGSLGFEAVSEVYDEDGIPHIDMVRSVGSAPRV